MANFDKDESGLIGIAGLDPRIVFRPRRWRHETRRSQAGAPEIRGVDLLLERDLDDLQKRLEDGPKLALLPAGKGEYRFCWGRTGPQPPTCVHPLKIERSAW